MPLIVIPCYNEAQRLDQDCFVEYAEKNRDITFLFVNDGSTDATAAVISSMIQRAGDRVQLLDLPANRGKAEAVRAGVLQAVAQTHDGYTGYWDADLATPLAAIADFMAIIRADPARRFVIGSRVRRMGARIERHWWRHYFGRFFATAASNILDLPVYDTQCGAKLVERSLAAKIFSQPFISPWLFDVELIARIIVAVGRPAAARIIYEQPLSSWKDVGKSKISPFYLPRIPYELFRIHRTYRHLL
jgi:dolichyl-phosphate beta-glucosyltransferase